MKSLTAVVMACSLSYAPEVSPHPFLPEFIELKESHQDTATNDLYNRMRGKDDILALFFESYGEQHKGFYVGRNLPGEEKYLLFHADDQENRRTVDIKMNRELESIESITVRKFTEKGVVKEVTISSQDEDALQLYKRMLETATAYIDDAEVTRHPVLGNFAKYNGFIEDEKFVSALENLMSKNRM